MVTYNALVIVGVAELEDVCRPEISEIAGGPGIAGDRSR